MLNFIKYCSTFLKARCVCVQVRVTGGEFSLLKWGIISLWFPNIKLSFYLWNPSCFFVIMKNTIFPQETALSLYICVMLWLLIGIFRILFWKRGLNSLRFVLLDWVTFAQSSGSVRVFLTLLCQLSLAHFRLFMKLWKESQRGEGWESRLGPQWLPVWAQGSLDRVRCIQLAISKLVLFFILCRTLSTVHFTTLHRRISSLGIVSQSPGRIEVLKSNEPSSWQVHSQQALLHFCWTYWRPRRLVEAWPVSVKKIFYTFGAVFSSHFDPVYILRAESVSDKHLACCWKGRGGECCINNENTQKLVLLTALLQ